MRRAGGFRTRYVPSWARLIWATLREWASWPQFEAVMDNVWENQQRRDRQRVCPHHAQISLIPGYVDCELCGICLVSPAGPTGPAGPTPAARRVIIVEPADGFGWERRHAWPGWQERYVEKGRATP